MVLLCRLLDVHRSGFYAWRRHPESKRSIEDRRLLGLIRASFDASQGIYGSKRIFCDLREVGETCGVHSIARIMRAHKIVALRGYKAHRFHYHKPAKALTNRLSQQFSIYMPDEAWVTDFTYYLYSNLSGVAVFSDGVWRRKPTKPVIIHSDQGSQYSSDEWKRFCEQHQLQASMSRRGNCYDNDVAESFLSSLKKERIRNHVYHTRDKARADIFDYIEVFYNRARRNSHLNGMSPEAFEEVWCKQG